MLDAYLWTEVRPDLSALGDIVDVDRRTNRSRRSPGAPSTARRSADRDRVLDGRYVAREIAYRAPNRVKGLALIATSAEPDAPGLSAARRRARAAPRSLMRLSRGAIAASLSPAHRTDPMIARVQHMSERLGGAVLARQSKIARPGDAARLSDILCPTIVIAAGADELRTVAESETLRDGIEGASLVVIEGSGHLVPLEQPAALLDALAPLAKVAG